MFNILTISHVFYASTSSTVVKARDSYVGGIRFERGVFNKEKNNKFWIEYVSEISKVIYEHLKLCMKVM